MASFVVLVSIEMREEREGVRFGFGFRCAHSMRVACLWV